MKREKQIQYSKSLEENAASGGGVAGTSGTFAVSKTGAIVKKKKKSEEEKRKPPKMANLYQEKILREAINKIIYLAKIKFFEEKGKQALEEQKLRKVIRHLLSEKTEPTPFKSTGLNTAAEVLQRIRRTVVDNYKSLTTSEEQRKNFIDSVETLVLQSIEQQDSMKEIEKSGGGSQTTAGQPVAGTEELAEQDEDPESTEEQPITQAAEPVDPVEKSKSTIKKITADISKTKVDTTGGAKAMPVVTTIVPQILSARDTLKDENDIKAFDLAILGGNGKIGNIKAFANIAEKELQATLGATQSTSLSDELASDFEGNPADTGMEAAAEEPAAETATVEEPAAEEIPAEEPEVSL